MFRSRRVAAFAALSTLLCSSFASAHIRLDVPMARQTPNLKTAPCGASTPGTPQVLEGWVAGATVTVEFTETINHPSHYRIALSRTGDDAFTDPEDEEDKTTDGIDLLDGIEDTSNMNNGKLSVEVKLPDEPCESCVLQLLQYMYDKPATPFYYNCADVVIGEGEGGGTGGSDGAGGSDSSADGGGDATGTGGEDGAESGGASSNSSGGRAAGGALNSGGSLAAQGGLAAVGGATSSSGGLVSSSGGTGVATGGSGEAGDDGAAGGGCSVGIVQPAAPWAWLLAGLAGVGVNRLRRRSSRT